MQFLRDMAYRVFQRKHTAHHEAIYQEILRFKPEQAEVYLRQLIKHAQTHVPFYTERLPKSIDWVQKFENIPLLTKATIKDNLERLKSDDIDSRDWRWNHTGGSTGQPLTVAQDRTYDYWRVASERFFYEQMLGVEVDRVPKVLLWGSMADVFKQKARLKDRIFTWAQNLTTLNTYTMSEEHMAQYIEIINKRKPVIIRGYAGSLHRIARYAKEHNLRLYHPKVVVSAAETLTKEMRELMEEMYGCKVHNYYGSREVGAIAGECKKGKIHIFAFNHRMEVLDMEGKPVAPGQEGRVIITTLHNYAMPLIRYQIEDTAIAGGACACGLQLPTIEHVTGRIWDYFVTKEGEMVLGGVFTRQLWDKPWVREFQVVQNDYEDFDIFYVPKGEPPQAEMEYIEGRIRFVMGENCQVKWHAVEEIPKTPQGKHLFTISHVSRRLFGEKREEE